MSLYLFSSQEEPEELKKKVAVLECQLRKSEAAKKSFEMSTGKLLSFVEVKGHTRAPPGGGPKPLPFNESRQDKQKDGRASPLPPAAQK